MTGNKSMQNKSKSKTQLREIFLCHGYSTQKSVPQGRAASSGTELFKGVWGRCHQQAKMAVPPPAGRPFFASVLTLALLARFLPRIFTLFTAEGVASYSTAG